MSIILGPIAALAIKTFFEAVMERAWSRIEGKTEDEILAMADEEKKRSESLQRRQEGD